jgi:hypothetical protein
MRAAGSDQQGAIKFNISAGIKLATAQVAIRLEISHGGERTGDVAVRLCIFTLCLCTNYN